MSHRRRRDRYQIVLQLMPGAEPWVRVEHATGWFKVPAFVSLEEVLHGVQRGWTATALRATEADTMVRVPLAQWLALQATAGAERPRLPINT